MFRQSLYCNKIFNWYNKDIKGFNNNPTWLFYKISILIFLSFTLTWILKYFFDIIKEQIMQEKDISQKMLEQFNDVFSDIVNVLLFNGENVVDENSLLDTPTTSMLKIDGSVHSQDRDVSKYWQHSRINIALFGFENQTVPDKLMPLRVISYDGIEYGRQTKKRHRYKTKYPVITLVLYLGYKKRWNYPINILDIVKVDDRLKPFVNDYKINLFEIAYLEEEKTALFKSDFRILVDYLHQLRTNNSYNPKDYTIKHINELLTLMSVMTGDNRFEDSINEANEKEAKYMCEVLDIIENRGIERGLEKGRQEGADMVSKLNELLLNEGNIDKLRRANTDKDYRYKLLREYNILK